MGGRFGEILLLLIVVLLLFGPNKLPSLAKAVGEALREFKKAANTDPTENTNSTAASVAAPEKQPPALPAKAKVSRKKRSSVIS